MAEKSTRAAATILVILATPAKPVVWSLKTLATIPATIPAKTVARMTAAVATALVAIVAAAATETAAAEAAAAEAVVAVGMAAVEVPSVAQLAIRAMSRTVGLVSWPTALASSAHIPTVHPITATTQVKKSVTHATILARTILAVAVVAVAADVKYSLGCTAYKLVSHYS